MTLTRRPQRGILTIQQELIYSENSGFIVKRLSEVYYWREKKEKAEATSGGERDAPVG